VKYYHRKSKANGGSKRDVSLLAGEWFSVINDPPVLPLSFDLSSPSGFGFDGSFGLCSAKETNRVPLVPAMSDAEALSLFLHRPLFSQFLLGLSSIFCLHPSQLSGIFRWPPCQWLVPLVQSLRWVNL
jgi:hypothetical protein